MNSKNEKSVEQNIQKSLSGDPRAFAWIIDKYQKRIYFSIYQIVMNHDDTDDVVQETFIKAYTKLDTYDRSYPFYPWLYRIAINTSINYQKKKMRHRALSLDELDSNNHHRDIAESPSQLFESESSELVLRLKEALTKLPAEQRAVFLLRVREELSYKEISDTLEISIGTVMSRLSRAREKLRIHLHGYFETKDSEV
ncbi:MAG: RNA polymerase sigma factor [bacterium]